MTDLPAALASVAYFEWSLERPCRPCQDDQHERCLFPVAVRIFECCCDDLDRDPDPPRWHP